jgi:hypothetical protein
MGLRPSPAFLKLGQIGLPLLAAGAIGRDEDHPYYRSGTEGSPHLLRES